MKYSKQNNNEILLQYYQMKLLCVLYIIQLFVLLLTVLRYKIAKSTTIVWVNQHVTSVSIRVTAVAKPTVQDNAQVVVIVSIRLFHITL